MVEVASTNEVLRKRVRRLLRMSYRRPDPSELHTRIFPLLLSLGEVALIGGAIRDLARAGRSGFNSDLDFVVYGNSHAKFREAMYAADAKPNRFGGYALRFIRWKVDVWHLEDTWARTAGLRKVEELSDLLLCTFFDWDSIVYDLRTGKLISDENYLNRLRVGIMDLCLEENPNPEGSLVRALRRAALWHVRFGPKLSAFSRRHLSTFDWEGLVERDRAAFNNPVLAYLDPHEIKHRLECEEKTGGITATFPVPSWERQASLPFDYIEKTSLTPASLG